MRGRPPTALSSSQRRAWWAGRTSMKYRRGQVRLELWPDRLLVCHGRRTTVVAFAQVRKARASRPVWTANAFMAGGGLLGALAIRAAEKGLENGRPPEL